MWKHIELVFDRSRTKGVDRAIMLVLAHRADKDTGVCWPGVTRIASEAGLTKRTVSRHLSIIEGMGELRVERRSHTLLTRGGQQRSNLYRITLTPSKGGGTESPPLPDKVGTETPEGKGTESPKVGTGSPQGRDGLSPEPKENQKDEPKGNRKRRSAGLSGQRLDYQKAEPPSVEDCGDIHNCPDPILAAMAVTGERSKRAWGFWVKTLNRARKVHGVERAERLFKECVAELWGEIRQGECRKPGAILNLKLKKVLI